MSSLEEYIEIKCQKGFFYTSYPQGVRFGDELSLKQYKLEDKFAIFSSSLGVNMVPRSVSKDFFRILLEQTEATERNGLFYVNCGARFDDVYFMF